MKSVCRIIALERELFVNQKIYIVAAFVVVIAIAGFLWLNKDPNTLHVNQVGADPLAYSGNITVTGIMAGAAPGNPAIFGMFDVKELQCKTPNCNKLYLPVRHQGPMPKPGDEVLVTGSFATVDGGMLFDAKSLKVVRNHKIGG